MGCQRTASLTTIESTKHSVHHHLGIMASPPKIGFLAPVPRTNVQANALRTATSTGIIADFQVRKSKIKAYYDYLRNGAPYTLTPEQLADIDLHQRIAMSELNEELDWKIASIYMDSGLPHLLEPAPTAEASQMPVQADKSQEHGELEHWRVDS